MQNKTQAHTLVDLCLCGHGRKDHRAGFMECLLCSKKHKGFKCRPGMCDRFTWNPDAEKVG